MGLYEVTPPADGPLSLADLKTHLKVDTSVDDALITALGAAATKHVEVFTRRKLITTTYDLKLDGFPCGCLEVPFPPVQSITSVSYVDGNGTTQTWAAGTSGYTTDLPVGPYAMPARIYPSYGVVYPTTRDVPNAVTVRFVCGYGDDAEDVPAPLLVAIKHLVEHWYTNRGVVAPNINSVTSVVPVGFEALLYPFLVP